MSITLETSHLILILIPLMGAVAGLWKVMLKQAETRIFDHLASLQADVSEATKVRTELMELRVELSEKYLRREDYIRGQTTIEAKLDAIASELKVVQIQGARP